MNPQALVTSTFSFNTADWFMASDGYYYYRHILPPGMETTNLINTAIVLTEGNGYHMNLQVIADGVQAHPPPRLKRLARGQGCSKRRFGGGVMTKKLRIIFAIALIFALSLGIGVLAFSQAARPPSPSMATPGPSSFQTLPTPYRATSTPETTCSRT